MLFLVKLELNFHLSPCALQHSLSTDSSNNAHHLSWFKQQQITHMERKK